MLSQLVVEHEPQMLAAHRAAVLSLTGASDASTLGALNRAGALRTATLMARLLGVA